MNNGRLYVQSNFAQRKTAFEVFEDFSHHLNWQKSEGKLLDIGTGSGDVLLELIVPKLPEKVKVYGSDISTEMVKFAKENFGNEIASFHQADICAEYELLAKKLPGPFDNITSFFCFHWIQNQRKAIENMYKLLKPHGSVLMEFLSFSPVFEIYEELSTFKCYEKYMKDVKSFVSPYQHLDHPLKLFREYINSAGFRAKHLEIRDQVYIYNADELKNAVLATNPFTKRMPSQLSERFMDDYFTLVERYTENKFIDESSEIIYRYKILVAVLTK